MLNTICKIVEGFFNIKNNFKDLKETQIKNKQELSQKKQELKDLEESIRLEKERHERRMREIEEEGERECQRIHEENELKMAEFKAKWEPIIERTIKEREEIEELFKRN